MATLGDNCTVLSSGLAVHSAVGHLGIPSSLGVKHHQHLNLKTTDSFFCTFFTASWAAVTRDIYKSAAIMKVYLILLGGLGVYGVMTVIAPQSVTVIL